MKSLKFCFVSILRSTLFIIFLIAISACSKSTDSKSKVDNVPKDNGGGSQNNPVTKTDLFQADPVIFEEDGTFYLYGTNDESPNDGFQVFASKDLKNWEGPQGYRNGNALSKIENYGNQGFWAPQVLKYEGKYYMAYTADEHIAISSSTHPAGPFAQNEKSALFTGTQKQIDPFIFKDNNNKKYLFYVDISNGNKIFMTEINDDFKSVKAEKGIECIRSTDAWENRGQPSALVTEGPTVIKHNSYYYLLYSANHFQNPNYAMGYATSKNVTGPWVKYEKNPILSRDNVNWSGSGHGDLIFDKNGNLYKDSEGLFYYVFHTHSSQGGAKVTPRKTAIVKMQFKPQSSGPDLLEVIADSFEHLMVHKK